LIDNEFFTPNVLELIGKAAEGDVEAIKKLRLELAKLSLQKLDLDPSDLQAAEAVLTEIISMDLELGE
jgi:hypothetical protein